MATAQQILDIARAENLLPMKTASCWQMMDAVQKAGIWKVSCFKPGDDKFGASAQYNKGAWDG